MTLELIPVLYRQARAFVLAHHRHHPPTQGWLFGGGLARDGALVGVACVGRPVAAALQDGRTCEVTRLCVVEATPNGCSKLYAAAWRAAKAIGYSRIFTYILDSEPGTSLMAAGWRHDRLVRGQSWDRPSRPRTDKTPVQNKQRWVYP